MCALPRLNIYLPLLRHTQPRYDALCEGADWARNGMLPDIDLVVLHLWPDSWLACGGGTRGVECKLTWAQEWLQVGSRFTIPLDL